MKTIMQKSILLLCLPITAAKRFFHTSEKGFVELQITFKASCIFGSFVSPVQEIVPVYSILLYFYLKIVMNKKNFSTRWGLSRNQVDLCRKHFFDSE